MSGTTARRRPESQDQAAARRPAGRRCAAAAPVVAVAISATLALGASPALAAPLAPAGVSAAGAAVPAAPAERAVEPAGEAAGEAVLSEDFSSGQLPEGWTSHRGSWQVKDGRLEGSSTGGERARISFGSSHENYRMDVTANFLRTANDSRWLNLAADFHGAQDYGSVFVVRSNTKLASGLEYAASKGPGAPWASPATGAAAVALNTNETHALSLEVRGSHARLSIDGAEYLSTDDLFRSGGTLGLVVNDATVAFDDLVVTELAAEGTPPGAPASPRVTQADGQATLSWSPPASAGAAADGTAATITGYEVAIGNKDAGTAGLAWTPATGTSHTFSDLAPGAYQLWVRAVNSEGVAGTPASGAATPGVPGIKGFAKTLNGGSWDAGHVQGIAVDRVKGRIYYSFTTTLVKTDLAGNILGTVSGFTGHLGDLDFNDADGRVYGSLEYKEQEAFYIAVIDVDAVGRIGMEAQNSEIVKTVHLAEVAADYTADMDQNGVFDGNIANTPDHRYGGSGIDGVSFGPRFGTTGGEQLLTVAYGVYSNVDRADNDHQVLLQYDTAGWDAFERPLVESNPHRSGPDAAAGKYFVRTGNTTYGVQNLEYDEFLGRWFLGVYAGKKAEFPNHTLFAVDAATPPVRGELVGAGGEGMLIDLAADGLADEKTGVRGWFQKADVGIESLGDGLFYLTRDGVSGGKQTADITLHRWTGDPAKPFVPVHDESELHRAPAFTSAAPAAATVGSAYTHTLTASAFPKARFAVVDGTLPRGLRLDADTGVLSGTPLDPGAFEFTVAADNGVGQAASQRVLLTVDGGGTGSGAGSLGSLGSRGSQGW